MFSVFIVILSCCAFLTYGKALKQEFKSFGVDGRIVGGSDANIEDIPYQVSIRYNNAHRCGGAIVNRRTILTAAHCFDTEFLELNFRSSFTIRVGSSQRYQGGDVYNLDAIHIHPSFNRTIPYNCDIAVVKLSSDLEFSSAIGPIKLPKMCPSSLVGKIGTVSGWGRTAYEGDRPQFLQKVELPIVNVNHCKNIYKDINMITTFMMCAGTFAGDVDSCNGDSGGPFVIDNTLYGIVSWGIECAHPDYPGVYTNVAYLMDWIQRYL